MNKKYLYLALILSLSLGVFANSEAEKLSKKKKELYKVPQEQNSYFTDRQKTLQEILSRRVWY